MRQTGSRCGRSVRKSAFPEGGRETGNARRAGTGRGPGEGGAPPPPWTSDFRGTGRGGGRTAHGAGTASRPAKPVAACRRSRARSPLRKALTSVSAHGFDDAHDVPPGAGGRGTGHPRPDRLRRTEGDRPLTDGVPGTGDAATDPAAVRSLAVRPHSHPGRNRYESEPVRPGTVRVGTGESPERPGGRHWGTRASRPDGARRAGGGPPEVSAWAILVDHAAGRATGRR